MVVKVNEIINWFYSNYRDKLVQVHEFHGTKEECFKRIYALRRSGRYDSARRYEFQDKILESEYQKWKDKNETIEMFYGSGVID
ncbi:hypothetical protein H8S37_04335 [Mediterraneibacter sp. NSJ-55]|uniref:Uncharacterized protein n=1 Tax=Mediterraneibacter hominis TaxID=2763054 RepID=A0A923LHI1_9FIRM|nr:hypothetical protein [Mediterraneibacter hominis]MBC5688161.1 hypothetical protein [Mediterraneibacter hominis]